MPAEAERLNSARGGDKAAFASLYEELLEEGSAPYGRARSAASSLGAAARAPLFRDLARSERTAAGALQHSAPSASSENQQLLQRHEDELNDGAHDEQRSENDGERRNNE